MKKVTVMTEKINFGKGIGPIGAPSVPRKADTAKSEAGKGATDRVAFSSVLQEVGKAKETGAMQSPERAQKVAALKSQIANGSYRPDLEKVAESLLKFIGKEG